jgi:predicted 3-demethylubiquinone-9 3-methyltransferase (glyoxalase superfamily)
MRTRSNRRMTMTTITPFLWFEGRAEEAMAFYASVFKDSKLGKITRFGDYMPGPKGEVMAGRFTICGQGFMVLNGGPNGDQRFTEAISFYIAVDTQEEIDYYWKALVADGGKPGPCGWLKDKYGVSWQVTPKVLEELTNDPDVAKADRVTKAMLRMDKIDIAGLQAAYDQA